MQEASDTLVTPLIFNLAVDLEKYYHFFPTSQSITILDCISPHTILTRSHVIQDGDAQESKDEEIATKEGHHDHVKFGNHCLLSEVLPCIRLH